jgi:hypothetical protein
MCKTQERLYVGYKRVGTRMAVERNAEIKSNGKAVPCMVMDLGDGGFRVRGVSPVSKGAMLLIDCSLPRDRRIQATVQVMHTIASSFGTRITEMSPEHRSHLSEFIEDLIAINCPRA